MPKKSDVDRLLAAAKDIEKELKLFNAELLKIRKKILAEKDKFQMAKVRKSM